MGLEARLRQLESKVRPASSAREHHVDIDQVMARLGLDPSAVRESARSTGSSLVEAMSGMLGIEPREFLRQLREAADGAR